MPTSATIITPDHPDYTEAATVYMGPGAPARVVRVYDSDQVAEAVMAAVADDLVLSVRSGGHSALAFGTNHGGAVVDVSGINAVEVVDAERGQVRIGAGATWGAVADSLGEAGLSLTSGDTKSVGVGGLTLGGGFGWLIRGHGLTIDHLVAAEIVTADGEVRRLSDSSHPDLFWAIRGGGGNFGVVTSLEFIAQRVTEVHAGMIGYTIDDVPGLLRRWSDVMAAAPEELNATLVLAPPMGPDLPPGALCLVCFGDADADAAAAALKPLHDVAPTTMSVIEPKRYADLLEDAHMPPGVRAIVSNTLAPAMTDELIEAITEFYGNGLASRLVFVRALGGAFSRVPRDATAFAHRDAQFLVAGGAFVPEPASDDAMLEAIAPFGSVRALGVGCYAGFSGTATEDDVAALYPAETYERLVSIKRRYDPTNVFSQNHNIRP